MHPHYLQSGSGRGERVCKQAMANGADVFSLEYSKHKAGLLELAGVAEMIQEIVM